MKSNLRIKSRCLVLDHVPVISHDVSNMVCLFPHVLKGCSHNCILQDTNILRHGICIPLRTVKVDFRGRRNLGLSSRSCLRLVLAELATLVRA